MSEITLKTGRRSTSVPRQAIRRAVKNAYTVVRSASTGRFVKQAASPKRMAKVTKQSSLKKAS